MNLYCNQDISYHFAQCDGNYVQENQLNTWVFATHSITISSQAPMQVRFFIKNFILSSEALCSIQHFRNTCTDSYVKINSLHNLHKPIYLKYLLFYSSFFVAVNGLAIINGPTYFSGIQWKVDHIFIESKIVTSDTWKKKMRNSLQTFSNVSL